jgi:hypothetical protein
MEAGQAMGSGYGRPGGLRPLSVGETLDAAIKVYAGNAVKLWEAVAIVVIPLEIIQLIIRRATLPSGVFVHDGQLYTTTLNGSTGGLLPVLLVALIGVLAQLLSTGAVFKLVLDSYLGGTPDLSESYAFAKTKVFSLLWLSILIGVFVAIGFVLLIIPGIYILVATSVAIPVLMLEGITGFQAIRRSAALVSHRWWATFGRLVTAFLLVGIASAIIGVISGGLSSALSVSNVTLFLTISALLSAVVTILTTPFTAGVLTVIYIDLRVRKEALDIELLAGEAGSGGAAAAAGGAAAAAGGAAFGGPAAPAPGGPPPGAPAFGGPPPPPPGAPAFGGPPPPPPGPADAIPEGAGDDRTRVRPVPQFDSDATQVRPTTPAEPDDQTKLRPVTPVDPADQTRVRPVTQVDPADQTRVRPVTPVDPADQTRVRPVFDPQQTRIREVPDLDAGPAEPESAPPESPEPPASPPPSPDSPPDPNTGTSIPPPGG